ncbi:MAG TPA: long-chain fatty acid--CoA ligase [Candidatus Angelobacter sp.]
MNTHMHTMMNYPLTLTAILERAGRYFGDVEVVSRLPDKSIHRSTWGEVYGRARRLAECLQSAGLKKGDRVATLMWNHYAHLEAHFGVPAAGGILHALNLRLHPDEIAYIANHAQDRFLIVDDVLLPVLDKFKSRVNFERIFVVPHCGRPVASEYENYEAWLKQASGRFEYPPISEDDGAAMCFTSGTTGNPKGVIYSHRSQVLHTMVQATADSCGSSQGDVILLCSPMFHANGWGMPYTAAMVGAKFVLPGPHLDADSVLYLIDHENVTLSCAVPTVWLPVLAALDERGHEWKPPRDVRILCGGTAPPESLMRGLERHGFHLLHSWGMTETSPQGTVSALKPGMRSWPEDRQYTQHCKQGYPAPFVELRIRRDNDQGEAPWDSQTMGELEVRGPWVAGSYYNAPGTENRWTDDGWFRTGDVATVDPDGCIKLVDRSKDMIKSGGEWISSVDVENALMGHPAVREAGVIGVPHPKWQERPLAVVALKDGATATPDQLRDFLGAKFAKWQLPDDFVFVGELPHTSTGKLLKTELRTRYRGFEWKP